MGFFIRLVLPQDETIHRRDRNDDMSCSSCDGSNQKRAGVLFHLLR